MKALVTGGYGYIGGHLVTSLMKRGWEVTILDSMFNARDWTFFKTAKDNQLSVLNASVVNEDAVARAMQGVNVVYHLAARMDWQTNTNHVLRLYNVNTYGTAMVLAAARNAGVDTVVFASSAAVYGNVVDAAEDGPTDPVNIYGSSKLAAEGICRGFCNLGMNVIALRFFNVWGGKYSVSVVNRFVDGVKELYGDGFQTRDFIHVDDVVTTLLSASRWEPMIYNIGTGAEISIAGLWTKINGDEEPVFKARWAGQDEIQRSCANMEATYRRVAWRPKVVLADLTKEEIVALCRED